MPIAAARTIAQRSVLVASGLCVLVSLVFLARMGAGTPITMLVGAKSALMIGLIGLRSAAGLEPDAESEEEPDGR